MGNVQAIPGVGEFVTLAEGAGKTIAVRACVLTFQTGAASELVQGAGRTFVNYAGVNAVAANVHMAVAEICGDDKKVRHLRHRQEEAWFRKAESTPVVGQGIGVGRYIVGDTEGGNRCMISASRTTWIAGVTFAMGGIGGIAAAGAYDTAVTQINSAANGRFAPVGVLAGIDRAVQTGNADDVFDAIRSTLIPEYSDA